MSQLTKNHKDTRTRVSIWIQEFYINHLYQKPKGNMYLNLITGMTTCTESWGHTYQCLHLISTGITTCTNLTKNLKDTGTSVSIWSQVLQHVPLTRNPADTLTRVSICFLQASSIVCMLFFSIVCCPPSVNQQLHCVTAIFQCVWLELWNNNLISSKNLLTVTYQPLWISLPAETVSHVTADGERLRSLHPQRPYVLNKAVGLKLAVLHQQ